MAGPPQHLLDRLRKLQALAADQAGTPEGEAAAQAAASLEGRLRREHGLSGGGPEGLRLHLGGLWEVTLLVDAAREHGARVYHQGRDAYVIAGRRPSDADQALASYLRARAEVDAACAALAPETGSMSAASRDLFRLGLAHGRRLAQPKMRRNSHDPDDLCALADAQLAKVHAGTRWELERISQSPDALVASAARRALGRAA